MNSKNAYILPTTLFIVTLLISFLTLTLIWVTYHLNRTHKNINEITGNNSAFNVLAGILEEITLEVNEDFASPYSGWFSTLPEERDGYTLEYDAEDSKFDINHIDFSSLRQGDYFKKDKKTGKYFYYIWEIRPFLNEKIFDESNDYSQYFTITSVPNLNVSKVERIKMFMESQMIAENIVKDVIERINSFRGGKNYLTENGLLINEDKYLNLRTYFPRNEMDRFYALFDYQGRVNLNFVKKEVFELGIGLCNPPKDDITSDVKKYWTLVSQKHESETTIKNINEIFGNAENKYKKYFSVDSSVIKISVKRKETELTAFMRKYKDSFGKTKFEILKSASKNKEYVIPDMTGDMTGDMSGDSNQGT